MTPLNIKGIVEWPVFNEPFLTCLSPDHPLLFLGAISEKDLSLDDIWLLNEGHCFRDQAIEICKKTRGKNVRRKNLIFESGNLETLKRLVDQKFGYTLLPWLATLGMSTLEQKKKIRFFKAPVPTREVSIVYTRSYLKESIIEVLHKDIVFSLPKKLKNSKIKERVIGISSLKQVDRLDLLELIFSKLKRSPARFPDSPFSQALRTSIPPFKSGKTMSNKTEQFLEKFIFNSRWLLAPFFPGLVISIALLFIKFSQELIHLTSHVFTTP